MEGLGCSIFHLNLPQPDKLIEYREVDSIDTLKYSSNGILVTCTIMYSVEFKMTDCQMEIKYAFSM